MVFHIPTNMSLLPQQERADGMFSVCLPHTLIEEESILPEESHIIKSQHLTSQLTRAGTLI